MKRSIHSVNVSQTGSQKEDFIMPQWPKSFWGSMQNTGITFPPHVEQWSSYNQLSNYQEWEAIDICEFCKMGKWWMLSGQHHAVGMSFTWHNYRDWCIANVVVTHGLPTFSICIDVLPIVTWNLGGQLVLLGWHSTSKKEREPAPFWQNHRTWITWPNQL